MLNLSMFRTSLIRIQTRISFKMMSTANINEAVDKAHEGKTLRDILKCRPSALQGIAEGSDELFKKDLKIRTVKSLGRWKFFKIARAIAVLAEKEKHGERISDSLLNINAALDKDHTSKSFGEIVDSPPSVLLGLNPEASAVLASKFHVKTIGDLAKWRFCLIAESITELAKYEL